MGCDSSKQDEQEVGGEGKRPGHSKHSNELVQETDGEAVIKNAGDTRTRVTTTDENRNEGPATCVQSDCKNVQTSHAKPAHVVHAWDAHPRGKARPLQRIEHTRGSATEVYRETEYDKEGIDLYSTSLNVNTPDASPRSSPDGIHANSDERHKGKVMTKAETEQAFDPSDLIDVEKFKAVNVPTAKKAHGNERLFGGTIDQEYQMVADEPCSGAESSRKAGGPVSAELPSPSNSDFYDEDEKELMANIEKDFLALPGAVE